MRTSLFSCMMILRSTRKILDRVSSSTNQKAMMFIKEFPRIIQGMMLMQTIFMLLFLETKVRSVEVVGRFSGPNDHIFIYYTDHGAAGLLGMPTGTPSVFAIDLIDVLKKKHAAKGYKSMVFYLEACESGSIFEGLLPKNVSIYAPTSANAEEDGYATYCPGQPGIPAEYDTCLGDLFSISWMEDCDKNDLHKETLEKQYERVRRRTNDSHVMQYGDMSHRKEFLLTYMGADPANDSYTSMEDISSPSISRVVSQRDADLLHLHHKFHNAPAGSHTKLEAQKQLLDEIAHRKLVDYRINKIGDKIGELLFGHQKSSKVLLNVRPQRQPLVDD
ncbi:unnamed protein product [Prunus brigantina]